MPVSLNYTTSHANRVGPCVRLYGTRRSRGRKTCSLDEGPPNQHTGQGTACRRFPFANAMFELLWVNDPSAAQSESTKRTLLWERWSSRQGHACPFGICVRPVSPQDTGSPFPAWEYRQAYLPDPLSLQIGEAGIEEPIWVHLNVMRRAQREG